MLISAANESNYDPGAFTRIAFKYHPNEESSEKNKVINIKNIRYNYMSDIRPEIRNKLSGSISTNDLASSVYSFFKPASHIIPILFPAKNNVNRDIYRGNNFNPPINNNQFIF